MGLSKCFSIYILLRKEGREGEREKEKKGEREREVWLGERELEAASGTFLSWCM